MSTRPCPACGGPLPARVTTCFHCLAEVGPTTPRPPSASVINAPARSTIPGRVLRGIVRALLVTLMVWMGVEAWQSRPLSTGPTAWAHGLMPFLSLAGLAWAFWDLSRNHAAWTLTGACMGLLVAMARAHDGPFDLRLLAVAAALWVLVPASMRTDRALEGRAGVDRHRQDDARLFLCISLIVAGTTVFLYVGSGWLFWAGLGLLALSTLRADGIHFMDLRFDAPGGWFGAGILVALVYASGAWVFTSWVDGQAWPSSWSWVAVPSVYVFSYCVLPAVFEEVLVRGALWHFVVQRAGPWATILSTAAIFGLFHGHAIEGLAMPIQVLAGIGLGWLRHRSQSLGPCILAHFLMNLALVAWAAGEGRIETASAWGTP